MTPIDPFRALVEEWDALKTANAKLRADLESAGRANDLLGSRVATLLARLLALEAAPPPPPPDPPTGGLPRVPFSEPPLKLNRGSWDDNRDQKVSHEVRDGKLIISIAQGQQQTKRVIRRDFGLHDPDSKGYMREPIGKLRRYELKVRIPEDYDSAGELCTCGLKFHTHSARDPAYMAWIVWTTTTRFRRNGPDGTRVDYAEQPIRRGHVYALAIEAKWSKGKDGTLKAWQDGELVMDFRGPNFREEEEKAPYLLVGAYYPSAIKAFSNIIEFSELRVGSI